MNHINIAPPDFFPDFAHQLKIEARVPGECKYLNPLFPNLFTNFTNMVIYARNRVDKPVFQQPIYQLPDDLFRAANSHIKGDVQNLKWCAFSATH